MIANSSISIDKNNRADLTTAEQKLIAAEQQLQ
jgi:hypothetical protein